MMTFFMDFVKAYGLTETTGRVFGTVGLKESLVEGATGKLMSNFQAKIVDPETTTALPPLTPGELWLKGPCIMKGKQLIECHAFYLFLFFCGVFNYV